jgi:hypothetical protein
MSLRIRRGTDAQRQQITPDEGELIYTTNTKKLFIGDGIVSGGINIGSALAGTGLVFDIGTQTLQVTSVPGGTGISSVSADLNPALGGNLNLSNHNITGTGTIGIVGTMYATQGLGGDLALNTHSINGTGNISITGNLSVTGLGADLNLNTKNITGTGNITTSGTLSVTGLGADLSLNGHNITGTGNITTSGTLSVTGLGADLNLNTKNITGTGNITTSGTLSVTGSITGGRVTGTSVVVGNLTVNSNSINVTSGSLYVYNNDQQIVTFRGINVDGNGNNTPQINLFSSRGTTGVPTSSQSGDFVMSLNFGGYNGSGYQQIASIISQYAPTANMGSDHPASNLAFTNSNGTGENLAIFDYQGTFSAPTLKTGSYNGSGSYPTIPVAGMIIFDSSNQHFYGYNGSIWKQLDN